MRKELPEQLAILKLMLSQVNAEWRELARQTGRADKLLRLNELRSRRFELVTRIFSIEERQRLVG